jgi:hypothetical protein
MILSHKYSNVNLSAVKKNSQGGVVPQDLESAKKVDLITLPEDVPGTNCFNCKWIEKKGDVGHCKHPKVDQMVNDRNCCSLWDNSGVERPWVTSKN